MKQRGTYNISETLEGTKMEKNLIICAEGLEKLINKLEKKDIKRNFLILNALKEESHFSKKSNVRLIQMIDLNSQNVSLLDDILESYKKYNYVIINQLFINPNKEKIILDKLIRIVKRHQNITFYLVKKNKSETTN